MVQEKILMCSYGWRWRGDFWQWIFSHCLVWWVDLGQLPASHPLFSHSPLEQDRVRNYRHGPNRSDMEKNNCDLLPIKLGLDRKKQRQNHFPSNPFLSRLHFPPLLQTLQHCPMFVIQLHGMTTPRELHMVPLRSRSVSPSLLKLYVDQRRISAPFHTHIHFHKEN